MQRFTGKGKSTIERHDEYRLQVAQAETGD
jgi:hypothetical protein